MLTPVFLAGAVDLLLPRSCLRCGSPGESLCADCVAVLAHRPHPVPAEPVASRRGAPAGSRSPPTWAAGPYEGALRTALLAYKERGRRDLGVALAQILTVAVVAAAGPAFDGRLCLVPVPSTSAAARRRGGDHMGRLTARVAAVLVAGGYRAQPTPVLWLTRRPRDSVGLGRAARAANLAGAFRAHGVDRGPPAEVCTVLLDDVVTTGATLREAARVLRTAGAGRVVAATLAGGRA